MSAFTSTAIKALIESAGLGISAYRDEAPANAALPYVTIFERIALVPDPSNARFSNTTKAGNETVQVDIWEQWRDPSTKAMSESYTLSDALARLLDGAALPAAPGHVWGVKFISSRRLPPEQEANLVHTAMTLEVVRDI